MSGPSLAMITTVLAGTPAGSRAPARSARPVVASVLAGAASGSRSSAGLAALTLAASPGAGTQPDRILGRPWAKAIAALLAAGEITADKLPQAPSRLAPPGLASRVAAGAAAGAVIARRASSDAGSGEGDGQDESGAGRVAVGLTAACVVAGAGTAAATSWLGTRWRAWASARLGHDWIGAVMEDAVAVGLAVDAAL